MNITSRFDHFAELHPDKPAFIFFQDGDWLTLTYRQLADLTQRFVSGLLDAKRGIAPGMTAALLTPPSADFFALAFALLKVGVVPIILDPAIGLKQVTNCLNEAKPDIFIGNGLTHTLRILFGWGRDSVRHNLTIGKVKSRRSKVKVPISNYQLPMRQSSTPAEAQAFPKAFCSRMRIYPPNSICWSRPSASCSMKSTCPLFRSTR